MLKPTPSYWDVCIENAKGVPMSVSSKEPGKFSSVASMSIPGNLEGIFRVLFKFPVEELNDTPTSAARPIFKAALRDWRKHFVDDPDVAETLALIEELLRWSEECEWGTFKVA